MKKNMNIELIPLHSKDKDIKDLMRIHASQSVAKYISISDNYFDYVTNTDKVVYYKILLNSVLVGGIHCEYINRTLFISICIDEQYRRNGIAEAALNKLLLEKTNDVDIIEVSIDETNLSSLSLFQKLGFSQMDKEDELIILRKSLN